VSLICFRDRRSRPISQYPRCFSQNQRDLKGTTRPRGPGQLPVERGPGVQDPEVLLRRQIIQRSDVRFPVDFDSFEALEGTAGMPRRFGRRMGG